MFYRVFGLLWCWLTLISLDSARAEISLDGINPNHCVAIGRVSGYQAFRANIEASEFGQLWNSAEMAPFRGHLPISRRSFAGGMLKRFGLSEDSFETLVQREIVIFVTSPPECGIRVSCIIGAANDSITVDSVIQAAINDLRRQGGQKVEAPFPVPVTVLVAPKESVPKIFAKFADSILISDDLEAAQHIAQQFAARRETGRASGTVSKLVEGLPKSQSLVATWICDPNKLLGSIDARRNRIEHKSNRKGTPTNSGEKSSVENWLRESLTGINSVAGGISVEKAGGFRGELIVETERKPAGLMKLFDAPAGDLPIPEFVTDDVSRVAVSQWNIAYAIERFGNLYDELTEAPGAFMQTIRDTKQELNVDLEGELFPVLGPRVTVLGRYDTRSKSEQSLVIFDIQSPQTNSTHVAEMVRRLFADDTETKQTNIPGQPNSLWEISFAVGDERTSFANAGLMVADGKLWSATHASFIQEILQTPSREKIHNAADYRQAHGVGSKNQSASTVLRSFTRIDRDIEFTYNTLKSKGPGGLHNPGSVVALIFATLLGATEGKTQVRFSLLPEFHQIRNYLGCTSWSVDHHESKWRVHYQVFPKSSVHSNQPDK